MNKKPITATFNNYIIHIAKYVRRSGESAQKAQTDGRMWRKQQEAVRRKRKRAKNSGPEVHVRIIFIATRDRRQDEK